MRWDVHLWALDEVASALAPATRGAGPGAKFELLQRLLDRAPVDEGAWLVLSDDDYKFRRGRSSTFFRSRRRPDSMWRSRRTGDSSTPPTTSLSFGRE